MHVSVRRVVLWSPPRTLSTALERCLIENDAIHVLHEPFGKPYYWGAEAKSDRENDSETQYTDTYASVAYDIFEALPPPGKRFVFSKNLSYYFSPHNLPALGELLGGDWGRVHHSFMIRDPAKAISSLYYKSCVANEATGYAYFDKAEAGFMACWELLLHLERQDGVPPITIIDADDLLADPEGMMTAYCEATGLPFDRSMLSWEPGCPPQLESPWTGWTDDVTRSRGLLCSASSPARAPCAALDVGALPSEVRDAINEARPIYAAMYKRALRVKLPAEPTVVG
jgi:hypothetical protein